ncbi:MAG TPA: cation diffusion facilitator family transporter, partial [Thermoanaerobaculia bacterium]|nr:cation diffusion facilitator family transporter [Thermoanaerobaculia bacterium]
SLRAVSEQSSALEADALHYTSDVVANITTITALLLVRLTGRVIIDSILAVPIAAWIAWNAGRLIWEASNELMDRSLPHHEIEAIIRAIERSHPSVIGFDNLKTRRAAGERFIEFELWIDREVSFEEAHSVTELVKERIHEAFPRVLVTVHAEPVEKQCRV